MAIHVFSQAAHALVLGRVGIGDASTNPLISQRYPKRWFEPNGLCRANETSMISRSRRDPPPPGFSKLDHRSLTQWREALLHGKLHVTREDAMATAVRSASRDKVRAHRARLRKQGLRPVQIWVPDVRSRAFARAAHRQSLAVAKSPHAREDQEFVDAISAWNAE
jgi:hypothetical protein